MKIYVVTMYRYGERESHSYVLSAFYTELMACLSATTEEYFRGGEYIGEVLEIDLDDGEGESKTIKGLPDGI